MTSSDEPAAGLHPDQAARAGRTGADPAAVRQLADQLHRAITTTFEDWTGDGDASPERTTHTPPAFARPLSSPPVRMEQLARTPEPTADLDDLVDLLVPRLVEQLVPALREALRDD